MINSSATDCSISFKFGTEFDHETPNLQQTFKVTGSKVKVTALKCHLIAKLLPSFRKSGSLNLMAMSEFLAVCVHVQYKIGQNQPKTTGTTSGGFQVAMHSQQPRLYFNYFAVAGDYMTGLGYKSR